MIWLGKPLEKWWFHQEQQFVISMGIYVTDLWYPSWFTARWKLHGFFWFMGWKLKGATVRGRGSQQWRSGVVFREMRSKVSKPTWTMNYPRTIWFILISDVHNSSLICSPNMLVELVLLLLGVVLQLSSSLWWGHAVEGNQYPPVVGRGNGKSPCINDVPSF